MTGRKGMAREQMRSGDAMEQPVAGACESGLDYANWLGNAWVYCLSEMGTEVSHFIADRIREDVRTQHAILHCKDPAGIQEIQKAFIDKAISDYIAETGRLVEIGKQFHHRDTPERAER
ncbi:hypothetical protein [Tropicimonas sediminicola]|uniref:Phasin protein n=1 Tax=Tropicimonas sediminicola TaxID=1031541 RepID=A0A239GXW0_9RHOB|nr:hypothetical protein [Tropicimonas sediminicola]SNS74039.1 hypothetical protein SAMN05421757_103161 [Tropicimonas sediminicola]